jgi:MFS family permease
MHFGTLSYSNQSQSCGDEPGIAMQREANFLIRNYVLILSAVAALNNCNLGYDMGIVSSVGPILLNQSDFPVSEVQLELFIGALDVSSLLGAAVSNCLADTFGRKACMAFSEVLFVISVLGMALAPNYGVLVVFRCVCGVAVGLGLTISPLYIGELAPSSTRGKLVSWSEIATNVGLLTAFIVGAALAGLPTNTSWRAMLGLGGVLPAVLLGSLYFMPESPRWLIVQGKVLCSAVLNL